MREPRLELLESIGKHPGMYLGPATEIFCALHAFVVGHNMCARSSAEQKEEWQGLVPHEFTNFLAFKFTSRRHAHPNDWFTIIRNQTAGESAGFALFFELLREFIASQDQAILPSQIDKVGEKGKGKR